MDYGHELEFGAFLTPEADQLDRLLENAQLADVLGLDLVCLQDHPYAAKQADMWTLLSVIGARTTTVRLAPNVACLPLRPPVLLAKAAATLDRVTGGRVELGLGTGAFWDGIVAAGGPRRTPKEAVDALIEAIGIIRGFWAGDPLAVDGVHYSAVGLRPGPVPAQQIPIWLGAYKPRMLRVTARLADVWIPSMGYADPHALPALNAAIDAAAVAAGRAPESVRRAYNIFGSFGSASGFLKGTPADWAEQLAELTLAAGMTTYILGRARPAGRHTRLLSRTGRGFCHAGARTGGGGRAIPAYVSATHPRRRHPARERARVGGGGPAGIRHARAGVQRAGGGGRATSR